MHLVAIDAESALFLYALPLARMDRIQSSLPN